MMTPPFPPRCRRDFEPVRELASGGYGTVWLARQVALQRPAVVKVLHAHALDDDDSVKRFKEEARITAALAHPSVVVLIDHDVEDGVPWIAYEYLPGPDLRARLSEGPLAFDVTRAVARDVASALEAAHALGVLHRDVKPENVLCAGTDRFKLADFGIAKWSQSVKTKTGILLGTASYMAPEHIRGDPVDGRADQYALGVMLYELVTGDVPFRGSIVELLEAHMHRPPIDPRALNPQVPADLAASILRMLEKDPADRFPGASALRQALEATPGPAGRAPQSAKTTLPASRPVPGRGVPPTVMLTARARWAPAVAVAALGLGGLALAVRPRPAPPPAPSVLAPAPVVTPAPRPPHEQLAELVRELGALRIQKLDPRGGDKARDDDIRKAMGDVKTRDRLRAMLARAVALHDAQPAGSRAALWRDDGAQPGLARALLYLAEDLEETDREFRIRSGFFPKFLARAIREEETNPLLWSTYGRWLIQAHSAIVHGTPADLSVRLAGHAVLRAAALLSCTPEARPSEAMLAILLLCAPRDPAETRSDVRDDAKKLWRSWRTLYLHAGEWYAKDRHPRAPLGQLLMHLRWRSYGAHVAVHDVDFARVHLRHVAKDFGELAPEWQPLITHLRRLKRADSTETEAESAWNKLLLPVGPGRELYMALGLLDQELHRDLSTASAAFLQVLAEAETQQGLHAALEGALGATLVGVLAPSEPARASRLRFLERARAAAAKTACPDEPDGLALVHRALALIR